MNKKHISTVKAAKWGYILVSVLMLALGVLFITAPDFSVSLPGIICGIVLILFGAVRLIGYFSKEKDKLAFQFDLALGIIMIISGILMLLNPTALLTVACFVLGISILSDSIFKLQIAFEARRAGVLRWWLILITAIIAAGWSIMLLFRPSDSLQIISIFIGISLIFDAIMNFITVITAVKIVRNNPTDIIDVESDD